MGDQLPQGRGALAADDQVYDARQAVILGHDGGMGAADDHGGRGVDLLGAAGEVLDVARLVGIAAEADDIGAKRFHHCLEIGDGFFAQGEVKDPGFMGGGDAGGDDFKVKRLQVQERMEPFRHREENRGPDQQEFHAGLYRERRRAGQGISAAYISTSVSVIAWSPRALLASSSFSRLESTQMGLDSKPGSKVSSKAALAAPGVTASRAA